MKYDPIISEQMKHLPKGCLTALTEDILRQTHPPFQLQRPASPPPNACTSLLIIMGYGSRVRSGQSPAGDELQIKQKVQKSGCFSTLAIWTLARNLSPCACFNVPLLIQKKGWHTKDPCTGKGKKKSWGGERWREQKKCNSLFVVFVLGLTVLVVTLLGTGLQLKLRLYSTIHFWKATKEKIGSQRHEHKNAHRVTML